MHKNLIMAGIYLACLPSLLFARDTTPFNSLAFHGTKETLLAITNIIESKQKGAYLRFGDGDVNLAIGANDALQNARQELMLEMREAFALNGPTVLKTLPLYCSEFNGYEPGMSPGNHEAPYHWCLDIVRKAKPLWGEEITDVYSHVALHFAASDDPDFCIQFLKFLKKSPCYMFIGNANIPQDIRDMLFGKDCIFIPTPPQQSYNAIDAIEQECLKHLKNSHDYKVIVTAMGCSGRALQKRLWKKLDNIFLFDFGSVMDALCGWNTRAWIEITKFDEKTFIENLTGEIKIICTAALLDQDYERRKQEYKTCLEQLSNYGYKNPYIVDPVTTMKKTFLDDYSCHVLYTQTNNSKLRNFKGVNEAQSLVCACNNLPFNDNDMVIKITGRYHFTSKAFLTTVENHPTYDVFVKLAPDGQVYTGCFGMRYKFFKEMLKQIDYGKMEREMINFEQEVARYIHTLADKQVKIMYLDKLDLIAPIFGNGIRNEIKL